MATGLDRLAALQNSRFGTSSSVRRPGAGDLGGAAGSQYRKQAEDYNVAMRLLRRQARRGDAGSALDAVRLREQANDAGFAPGGIRRKEEFDASATGSIRARERGAEDREMATDLMRRRAKEQMAEEPAAAGIGVAPAEGIGATVQPESRTSAALDLLGGSLAGDDAAVQRGNDSAMRLGVSDPGAILRGDRKLAFRKTLDSALGKARSPAEVAMLKSRAGQGGVDAAAFDRRANWWEKNRKI